MYFEVLVHIKLEAEDSRGGTKIKKINEFYLVDAISVTEAEARVVKLFKDFSQDYEVVNVKKSKIVEVVNAELKSIKVVENARQLPKEKDEEEDLSND